MRTRKEPALSYGEVVAGQSPGPAPCPFLWECCVGAWVASTSVYLCFHTQETVGWGLCALRGGGWADPESGPNNVASAACVRHVSGVTVV